MTFTNPPSLPTPLTPSMPLSGPLPEQIESLPITPPEIPENFDEKSFKPDSRTIKKALHVLATERLALSHLEDLYTNSLQIQESLLSAITQIIHSETRHGKTIFTGVGKSGHIAKKLVATFVSLGIHAVFLHPIEALHGDLGVVRPNDTVIMITFSGRTPELLSLLPHIPSSIPLIIMTAHLNPSTCPLLSHPTRSSSNNILLPTTIHESEISSFGVSAPTTSTTITLALGDSLALAVADEMHSAAGLQTPAIFAANHPGGAIGAALKPPPQTPPPTVSRMSDLATNVTQVPIAGGRPGNPLLCFDILVTAVRSPGGFVRTSPNHIIGPRRIQKLQNPELPISELEDEIGKVIIEKTDWISVLGTNTVEECKRWIHRMREEGTGRGKEFLRRGTLLGIVDHNEVTGVVEIEDLMGEDFV
ncbi:uncharacterized protein Z518_03986 [Rhinocladiella mackenziei CBS 650.93]|uniref:SIS domain-containing protein n=1 Tax=Rhinocladiella mackenziei CBS 650.93 TaxID=1442369 RepID=A0A0D2FVA9_9EURO|nr:uncharacterized protein Z518_03986 [Rhinocladiella mackenziei CBS 650.93]KIX06012.1 hypothetical protein Z518_03986 [Rhinocladiella mackenziei CBS 650.93]